MEVFGKIENERIVFLAFKNELQKNELENYDWRLIGEADESECEKVYDGTWLGSPLFDENGLSNYKILDDTPTICTDEDKADELSKRPIPAPTQLDRVEAQVAYTAMMTDTLLEE